MGLIALGCAPEPNATPEGECSVALWADARGVVPEVSGSWDDWAQTVPMQSFDERWAVAELSLPEGTYGYVLVERGESRLDPRAPLSTFRRSDGQEVSWLEVPACDRPRLRVDAVVPTADGATVDLGFEVSASGAPVDLASLHAGSPSFEVRSVDTEASTAVLVLGGLETGRQRIELTVADEDGVASEARALTILVGRRAATHADGLIYQIMIDRFRGEGGGVLPSPQSPGGRAGGVLDGVQAELDAGTFDELGVTALWLSPVYPTPEEPRLGTDGRIYEGYHGYWPLDARGVEPRIGGAPALEALIASAHARGIEVWLDLVPNHYDIENPRVTEHATDGWFHPQGCVCGTPSCPWDGNIQTCWFTDHLPDLRFANPEVLETAASDARWWQEAFAIDGVRIDAVPMMPRAVSRRIAHELRDVSGHRSTTMTLGEIFTGGGPAGTEALRYYLGPDGLDSAFDFPLMWALRSALAGSAEGFIEVEASLNHTRAALEGSGSTMARMIGNHDVTRFISEMAADIGADPWDDPGAAQPVEPEPYQLQQIALGLVLTLPGIPVIYYGDEVGLAGGRDPDNRRPMPEAWGEPAESLRVATARLGKLRRCSEALRRGERKTLAASVEALAFVRDASDDWPVVVAARRAGSNDTIVLGGGTPTGSFVDVATGELHELAPGGTLAVDPRSLVVLVRADDPCAQAR